MDVFAMGVVDLHHFGHVGFFLGEGEVEDAEIVLVGLPNSKSTSLLMTSLLYSMRAYWVLQSTELTTVAEYPAKAVQIVMSRRKVVLLILSTAAAVGTKMLKKVAYVQKVIELVNRELLNYCKKTFHPDTHIGLRGGVFEVCSQR